MQILILDQKFRYSQEIMTAFSGNADFTVLTECNEIPRLENVRIIIGSRRRNRDIQELDKYYDVVVDTDALVPEDLEKIYQEIKTDLYIYFSTFQVYSFLNTKIFYETDITEEYFYYSRMRYIDAKNNPRELYIQKRIQAEEKCMQLYGKGMTTYIILRLGKVYSTKDFYGDIGWIKSRIIEKIPFLFKYEELKKNGCMSSIYIRDLSRITEKIVNRKPRESKVYNICQDFNFSILELIEIVQRLMGKKERVVCLDNQINIDNIFSYRVPVCENLLMSNEKLKHDYIISFTDTEKWIKEILLSTKNVFTFTNEERLFIKHYCKYIDRYNRILKSNQEKGAVNNIYELIPK